MVISARHQPAVLIVVLKGNIDEMGDRSVRLCRQFQGAELFSPDLESVGHASHPRRLPDL